MSNDFSASASQKQGTTSAAGAAPFDAIVQSEQREEERIRLERSGMDRERTESERILQEKEATAEQELRERAREELKEYREKELTQIVRTAESKAQKDAAALEQTAKQREQQAVDQLVEMALNTTSSST